MVAAGLLLPSVMLGGFCQFTEVLPSSRSWSESKDQQDYFELKLHAPDPWRPYARIVLEWHGIVNITSVEGARVLRVSDEASSIVELELAGVRPSAHAIQVFGKGRVDAKPTVLCREASPPAPSEPHAEYCSMSPRYRVSRAWAEAAIIQVDLEYWIDSKIVTLTYFGEHLRINHPKDSVVNAELVDETEEDGNTILRVRLVPKDYLHGGKLSFSLQLTPPAHTQPLIECHAPWHPPPPRPPPPPSPRPRQPPAPEPPPLGSPSPPVTPPPVTVITADGDCVVGGTMKVEMFHLGAGGTSDIARIVVRMAHWYANTEVLSVISHAWNSKFNVGDLARATLVSQSLLPTADGSLLVFKPSPPMRDSPPFFGFNVEGYSLGIKRLSCRPSQAPPPSPPPFVFKVHDIKRVPTDGVRTSTDRAENDRDKPLGFVAVIILAAAFFCMFKDVFAQIPNDIAMCFRRVFRLPRRYGSVGTAETDIAMAFTPTHMDSSLGSSSNKSHMQRTHAKVPSDMGKAHLPRSSKHEKPKRGCASNPVRITD